MAQCAKAFDLNYRNFTNRIKGGASKSTRRASNQRLTEAQDLALLRYIRRGDDQCMSLSPRDIKAAANYIIQKDDGLAAPLGANWWARFNKQHLRTLQKASPTSGGG